MPTMGQSIGIYRRMHGTRLRRGRVRIAAAILLLLPIIGTVVILPFARDVFDGVIEIYFRFLLPFIPALGASSMVSEEIESKTFTFIFARPASRWAMVFGKYIAFTVPLVIGFAVSIAACYGLGSLRGTGEDFTNGLGHLGRVIGAASLGVVVFGALAALVGSWFTRHPFIAVMGYLLLVEALFGSLPVIINLVAMSWHLRNLAGLPLTTSAFFSSELTIPMWVSTLVVAGVSMLALMGASSSVSGAEYRTDR
jgi:ABC-type transport system involved in multi-copper enzyme maturation permease subunit